MPTESRNLERALPWAAGLAAFLLYLLTGARTIQWQDSAQFTYRIGTGILWNEYGLAMTHPLHFMLGRMAALLFPSNLPWAVAGVSALGGGLAVGGVAACVRRLAGAARPALFAAATLALAHSFWRFSGLPEVYTLSAALLVFEVYAFLRWREDRDPVWWWVLFGLNGLGFANHNLALLALPVWGLTFLAACRRGELPWSNLLWIGVFWTLGALPYLGLIMREMADTGTFYPVVHSALFGHGFQGQVTGLSFKPVYTAVSLAFLALGFPTLALPLAAACLRPKTRRTTGLPAQIVWILVLHLLFFLRYNVIDQYTFLIPSFALIALLAGCGFARLRRAWIRRAAWALLALQPVLYAFTPALVRASGLLTAFERDKPYRDDYQYLFWPWSAAETSAARMADDALDAAAPDGAVVIEDDMAAYTLAWERHRRGLEAVDLLRPAHMEELLGAIAGGRNVVWIPVREGQTPPDGWDVRGKVWVVEQNDVGTGSFEDRKIPRVR